GDTALVPVGGDRPRGLPAEDSRGSLLDETGWGLSIRPPPGRVVDPPLQGSCLGGVIGAQARGGRAVGVRLLGARGHGAQDAFTGNADLADGSGDYGVEVLHVVGVGGVVGASADAEEQSAVDRGLGELGPGATVADAAGQFPEHADVDGAAADHVDEAAPVGAGPAGRAGGREVVVGPDADDLPAPAAPPRPPPLPPRPP